MTWYSRKGRTTDEVTRTGSPGGSEPPDVEEMPLRPILHGIGAEHRQRIAAGLEALQSEAVEVDDLTALGAGFDAALATWRRDPKRHREDHAAIVERYAIGIGEHLARHTDLSWAVVRDAFGTDLAIAQGRDEFVVVPSNLVASRWIKQESGWVPRVVGHLIRLRGSS